MRRSSPLPARNSSARKLHRPAGPEGPQDHFEGPQFANGRASANEDARYVGLTVPRFLLRNPYDPEDNPVKSFVYKENVAGSHEHYLWGNTAYAFASRLTDSFAKFRWCPNIIGPQSGGAVEICHCTTSRAWVRSRPDPDRSAGFRPASTSWPRKALSP